MNSTAKPGLVNVNIDETVEMLGPCLLVQKRVGHRLTTDALLLADFAAESLTSFSRTVRAGGSVKGYEAERDCKRLVETPIVDIGTGNGAIAIMLALRSELGTFVGVEVQSELVELTRRNIAANRLNERISVMDVDYRELPLRFKSGSIALVVSNPPYIKAGEGRVSNDVSRSIARSEVYGSLAELVLVSSYLVADEGSICFIYPVKRYGEMLAELKRAELKVRRVRFIHTAPVGEAIRFLIEAGRTGDHVTEEPIFLPGQSSY